MGKFKFMETSIEGVYIVEPTVFGDERGYFMETYHE
ncbi:dTDP-4-dehydrorhamnose 3,5-epimerase family protein, partial [Methanobacterium aggregans]